MAGILGLTRPLLLEIAAEEGIAEEALRAAERAACSLEAESAALLPSAEPERPAPLCTPPPVAAMVVLVTDAAREVEPDRDGGGCGVARCGDDVGGAAVNCCWPPPPPPLPLLLWVGGWGLTRLGDVLGLMRLIMSRSRRGNAVFDPPPEAAAAAEDGDGEEAEPDVGG